MTLPDVEAPAVRMGVQTPRVQVTPDGIVATSGQEAAEFGELVGVYLDPWQRLILDIALGERVDGRFAAATIDVLASRQNGKNGALEVFELFTAVVLGLSVLHTAHQFKTSMKAHARIRQLIKAHPDVADKVTGKWATPAQGYIFEFESGGRIEFVTRSDSAGRGFTVDVLVIDEAQNVTDEEIAALMPALSARSIEGDPQIWYLGSAPSETQFVWQRRRTAWRAGGGAAQAAFEFSADPDSDLDDRDAWAQANPGLGLRIAEEFIADVERPSMSDEVFARERLSISPEVVPTVDREKVWRPGVWEHVCLADVAQPVEGLVLGVETSVDRSRTAVSVSSASGVAGLVTERPGTGWAIDEVARIARERNARVAIASNGPAATLIPLLEQQGVPVVPVAADKVRVATGWFYDQVVEAASAAQVGGRRAITVKRDAVLDAAVAAAAKKASGDGFVWDRRAGEVHPLVALTLAAWVAVTQVPAPAEPLVMMVRTR